MRDVGRFVLAAAALCAAAWAVLLLGLGNVGLQQSISIGPQVLLAEYPGVSALAFLVALGGTAFLGRWLRMGDRAAWPLPTITLILIAGMSWLVAPVLIGELDFQHGAVVFLVLSVVGLLPLGVLLGSMVSVWWADRGVGRGSSP